MEPNEIRLAKLQGLAKADRRALRMPSGLNLKIGVNG